MNFFRCKVCVEKDKRIADLKDQIAHLRQQVTPSNNSPPIVHLEADGILSGQQHVTEVEAEDDAELVQAEADRVLAGNY